MEGKTEIINYINSCDKCFAAFPDEKNHLEVLFIKYKKIYEDALILGIKQNDIQRLNTMSSINIAITMWNNIKGYQLKGSRLSEYHNKYGQALESFKQHLENNHVELSAIQFLIYNIKEFYHVTPGTLAGKEIHMEVSK